LSVFTDFMMNRRIRAGPLLVQTLWMLGKICGNLAQGDGLITLATSQAPVTSSPRKKLRASWTIEIIACS
jgi:hypothetical protein